MHDHPHDESVLSRAREALLPNCREMTRRSSLVLDAPVTVARRVGMLVHLLFCGLCRRYLAQLVWLRRASKESASAPRPRRPLPPGAELRIKRSLRAAAASIAGPVP